MLTQAAINAIYETPPFPLTTLLPSLDVQILVVNPNP